MRYVKQRDEYSCGPLSILNLCKWAGIHYSYDSEFYRWIKKGCGCCPGYGSEDHKIEAVLRKLANRYGWAVRKRKDVSIGTIKEELGKGNAVLCCFNYDEWDDHIALLTHYDKRGVWAVNWWLHKDAVRRVGWKYLEYVRRRKNFICWFIRRK